MIPHPPRIGVLGAAQIVPKALLAEAPGLVDVTAVGARDLSRARSFARSHGLPGAFGSYQEVIESPDVDLVYVALPVALHAEWTLRALRAGKHVLCEKPFALDSDQASACVQVANEQGRLLMEAQHWQYHSLAARFSESCRQLGVVRSIRTSFDASIQDAADIRLNPALGAGVLFDFGCYLLQWVQAVTGDSQPSVLSANVVTNEQGVDLAASASLRSAGADVEVRCDMRPEVSFQASIEVHGERGRVHWENPLANGGSRLLVEVEGAPPATYLPTEKTTYRLQLEALCNALRTGTPALTCGRAILDTQRQLDAVRGAAGLS